MSYSVAFDDVYAGYVLRDAVRGYITEVGHCVLKDWATRFTKQQAISYIESDGGRLIIEDAK